MQDTEMTSPKPLETKKQENVFLSLICNIIIPVFVLQKGAKLGFEGAATISLIVALSFPLIYGIHDYLKTKNKNIVSILGVINILITGVFAIAQFEGRWFALKEAAIPFVLGVGVLISIKLKKPFMRFLVFQSGAFKKDLLEEKIKLLGNEEAFAKQMNFSTSLLSISFFLSSFLNYVLALRIFKSIDKTLTLEKQKELLNQQIADMNWMGILVISVPLMVFLGIILWDFFRKIKKLSGLSLEDLVENK